MPILAVWDKIATHKLFWAYYGHTQNRVGQIWRENWLHLAVIEKVQPNNEPDTFRGRSSTFPLRNGDCLELLWVFLEIKV